MIDEIKPYLNFTQLLLTVSFVFFVLCLKKQHSIQKILFLLLALSLVMEVSNCFLLAYKNRDVVALNYSLFALIFNSIWLVLLKKVVLKNYYIKIIIPIYVFFGIANMFFYEGLTHFNHYNFIVGAFIYLFIFIYESFRQIKKENLLFFQTNNYLLLFAPVILMLGLSILVSFNNRTLNATIVFAGRTLYDIIGYFINLVYYSLLILYCYKEKNIKYD